MPTHLRMHHNTGFRQSQPNPRIIVIVVERHQQTLERLLRPLQVQHRHAQVIQNLGPLRGAQTLDRQLTVAGRRLDGRRCVLIEGEGMLEEADGHRVVSDVEMNDAHVVGDHRVVIFAVFSGEHE